MPVFCFICSITQSCTLFGEHLSRTSYRSCFRRKWGGRRIYFISGNDDADIIENTGNNPPILRAPWYKKLGRWAKKTVKETTKYIAPVLYSAIYGGNVFRNTWDCIKSHLNPIGIIQIFVHKETLHTKTNTITKNMEWLQHSYVQQYIYTKDPSKMNNYILDKCFGSSAFCAMKDTRMLAENWEVGFDEKNWEKVFPKIDWNGNENIAVKNRCWLTMAQMINHYKGGNISSDEILYFVRGGFGNTEGGGPIETMQAVNYALDQGVWSQIAYTSLLNTFNVNGILPTVDGWSVGTPMLYTIISTIESGNILGVSQLNGKSNGSHSMFLNGYKIASNGRVYIHLLNTHNMGESEWRYYCDLSFWGIDVIEKFVANGIRFLRTWSRKGRKPQPWRYGQEEERR